ncbi:MAG: hypothetical protein PHH37_06060 [Paludibacter sp.]|nr:hypothetical protein [Paludibacter sp.]
MLLKIKNILLIITAISLFSCSAEYSDLNVIGDENPVTGIWTDTTHLETQGKIISTLTFTDNGSFTYSADKYGIYSNQSDSDLSAYSRDIGNYVLSVKNIYFASKQNTTWDSSTGGDPVTTSEEQTLFDECSYTINEDTLTLNYITYSANAQASTTKLFTRVH